MEFGIPEDLKMIQTLVRDFVNDQLRPLERDILGRAADLSDARVSLPPETGEKLIAMVKDIGLWGVGVPEELGGVGLNTLGNCLVEEELAQTVIPFNLGDVSPILFDCNAAQREKYFLPLFHRQKEAFFALMEPGKGANLSDMETIAEKANGNYVVNGKKLSFSRISPDKDGFAVVFAITPNDKAEQGVSCLFIDKETRGFSVGYHEDNMGWRTQVREPVCLVFNNCSIPEENLLGEKGKAFHLGKKWLPSRRLVRAARTVGVALRLLEEATAQAQSWQSFDQLIYRRANIEGALADIAVGIHACRLVVYEAAWKSDEGQPIKREAAMVKLFAAETIRNVANRVSHIFGGPPHVAGLPMEELCRNALATSTTDLALELQRSIIAQDVLKGLKA
ncbi:acyl-CoA dehydrogenase family protein [Chloroflexota bacterium]